MSKKNKIVILRVCVLALVGYMIVSVANEMFTTARLYYNINHANIENEALQEETDRLNNEVLRLKDDDYIQSFVSGTIFQTREGTSVYILPDRNEQGE